MYDSAGAAGELEAIARIAESVGQQPSSDQALGLAVSLVDIAEGTPNGRELVEPPRTLLRELRSRNADVAMLDALEASLERLESRH